MLFRNLLLATTSIAACAICLPCRASPIPANEVTVFVGNNQGMPDPAGVAMFATFTPPGGLMAAAEALGYIGFDWQQTITNWPNPDLHKFGGALLTPVPIPNPPYLDPPLGGYNYNPCGGKAPGASAAAAYPFYFAPTGPSSNCWSLAANETSNTLSFADEPMDHELTAADIAAGNIPKFTTELVGILPGYIPGPELFEWTWDTTYNGTVASASILVSTSANSPYLNPGFGGSPGSHATILTINGVPVPEPPALLLLASGVLAMLAARKAAGWNGPRHRPG